MTRTAPPAPLAAADVKRAATDCGFALVGLAVAEALPQAPLRQWLADGHAADLHWMSKDLEARLDPRVVLPEAKTVVAMAIPYHRPDDERSAVARYARGRDYHYIHRDRLKRLRKRLLLIDPEIRTYSCVDTGKAMEKPWAARAGLGWIGKNGCLIHPTWGSWLTLSVMFLDREVDAYDTPIEDLCGSCEKCIHGCPTKAFAAPAVVDCRKCIAYHSIENRNVVPLEVRKGFRGRSFGCDVCQEVCPFNRQAQSPTADPATLPRPIGLMSSEALAQLTELEFSQLSPGTPLPRIGFHGLRRNAVMALGAGRKHAARALLVQLAADPEAQVAEAASWSLQRLDTPAPRKSIRGDKPPAR